MSDSNAFLRDQFEELSGTFFSEYHTNVLKNRQYYNRDFRKEIVPSESDQDIWVFIPTSARRAIDEPADHIMFTPKITVPIRPTLSDFTANEASAENKRRFASLWWHNAMETSNLLDAGRKVLLNEGRICARKTLRWDLIPDYPEQDAGETDKAFKNRKAKFQRAMNRLGHYEFLWNVELLDNLSVYEDPSDHRNPRYVFVSYDVLLEEAMKMFPKATGEWTKGDQYSMVKYLEYWSKPVFKFDGTWDAGKLVQWINDEVVHDGDNHYPYIPIAIEDAGYGMNYKGVKPHEKYVGITQHLHETFIAEARQMTTWENVTEITGFAPILTRNMDPTRTIKVGPKEVIPLKGGKDEPQAESVEAMQWPGLPLEVIQLAQRTNQMIDEATKMNTLGGRALPGVETATEADQQIRNASAKLGGPVAALSRLAAKLTSWVFMDIDLVIEAKVSVFGTGTGRVADSEIAVGPRDINGFYRVSAELTTTDEDAVSLNKARFWMEAYRNIPFLSAFTAMLKGDISDEPMSEMTQRGAEDVYLSPEMAAVRKLTGAQAFGELVKMLEAIQKGPEAGAPGAASDETMFPATTGAESVIEQGYENRDVTQGASQLRGGPASA